MNTEFHAISTPRRVMLGAIGALGLMLLVSARNIEPDPRGFGTHEQLGLAPCYFQESTGHVCPLCGGTTAWAHAHRGELAQAAQANLGGMLLFAAVVIGGLWLLLVAISGQWVAVRPTPRLILLTASAWLAVVALDWVRKIVID